MIYLVRREFGMSARQWHDTPRWEKDTLLTEYDREQAAIKREREKG